MGLICFASYEIHPTTAGGAGVLIHHAIDHLTAAGHEALLLLDLDAATFEKFAEHDRLSFAHPAKVRAFRVDDLCQDFVDIRGASAFQVKSLRFAHALAKLQATHPITLVEYFEYCGPGYYSFVQRLFEATPTGPVLASRIHGSVEVLERFGSGLVRDEHHFMQHAIERRALALSETLLVPTKAYFDAYYRSLYNLPDSRIVVSTPPKQAFPKLKRRPQPGESFSIAFIGRMFHLKGVDQMVHASVALMQQRPDLTFNVDLIGYDSNDGPLGSYTEFLRTLIPPRLRHRFEFHGQLSHQRIAAQLEHALFAVFPNRVESFCYALHEVYDAGVPVIANALPAFTDFFHHEQNCLLYDGSTQALTGAMERLISDAPLRTRITRPYAVAAEPLGDIYHSPRALAPLDGDAPRPTEPSLAIVLFESAHAHIPAAAAIRSLRGQTSRAFRVVCLLPGASPDGETLWWCGRPYTPRDWEGKPIGADQLVTAHTLAVFRASDEVHASWLLLCRRALARRPSLAFAGAWDVFGGATQPGTLDLVPELAPFQSGTRLHRVLLRTRPGQPLSDLLDPSLGELGHLGLIWQTIGTHGPGVLLPRPLVRVSEGAAPAASAAEIKSLILRYGAIFGDRLAIATTLLALQPRGVSAPLVPHVAPAPAASDGYTVEHKVKMAADLGGTLLARLALQKFASRLAGTSNGQEDH
ncbi:MAG: glycosyltransferase family 4 protein [Phycisphaerales bacterium]|jgi:glycosyltransferase involved in cell wall biosynthesis